MRKSILGKSIVVSTLSLLSVATFAETAKPVEKAVKEKKTFWQKVGDEIRRIDISANADLFDIDITDELGLGFEYEYEVEPAYVNGYYSRADRWKINVGFDAGDFLVDVGSPLYVGIRKGAEVTFIRHFKSQKKAVLDAPIFNPRHIPLKAEWAKKYLRAGEAVLLPVNLNLFAGLRSGPDAKLFEASLGTEIFLRGSFLLQVLKLDEDQVRLRLVAQRRGGTRTYARVDTDFEIFDINAVDKLVRKVVSERIFDASLSAEDGVLYMVDYLFDLGNPDAAAAYDKIMGSGFRFRDVKVVNPFNDVKETADIFVNDLRPAAEIIQADASKPIEERRIRRIFQGFNDFKNVGARIRGGLQLASFSSGGFYTRNTVSFENSQGQQLDFLYPTYSENSEARYIWGIFRENQKKSVSILYDMNEDPQRRGDFTSYVVGFEVKDKVLDRGEKKSLETRLQRSIRKDILDQLDLSFLSSSEKNNNSRVYAKIVFHKEAFAHLRGISAEVLKKKFDEYVAANDLETQVSRAMLVRDMRNQVRRPIVYTKVDFVGSMVRSLENAFSSNFDSGKEDDVLGKFVDLRHNPVFGITGTGFLMSLLEASKLEESVFIRITSDSDESGQSVAQFGDKARLDVIQAMEYIQNMISNGTFDLRLETFGTPIKSLD